MLPAQALGDGEHRAPLGLALLLLALALDLLLLGVALALATLLVALDDNDVVVVAADAAPLGVEHGDVAVGVVPGLVLDLVVVGEPRVGLALGARALRAALLVRARSTVRPDVLGVRVVDLLLPLVVRVDGVVEERRLARKRRAGPDDVRRLGPGADVARAHVRVELEQLDADLGAVLEERVVDGRVGRGEGRVVDGDDALAHVDRGARVRVVGGDAAGRGGREELGQRVCRRKRSSRVSHRLHGAASHKEEGGTHP